MKSPDAPERRVRLTAALEQHQPSDAQEQVHLERMKALVRGAADPFHRETYDPGHFTASAFVVSPDRCRLLLILHGKLGLWLQPGGHVEPSDASLLEAALREVTEETGVAGLDVLGDGLLDVDVHAIPARGESPTHEHFDVRFLVQARSEEIAAGSEVRGARWVPLTEVGGLHSDDSVMRAVAKLKRRLG